MIDDSVQKVSIGSDQVEAAGATMQEIVASVRRVTSIINEISSASEEQSRGIQQVNQAVSQMDSVTQQNAALVEQAAASAASLETQSQRLREAVAVFVADRPRDRGRVPGAGPGRGAGAAGRLNRGQRCRPCRAGIEYRFAHPHRIPTGFRAMNARIPDDALPPTLDPKALQAFVDDKWDNEIIPALTDYIAVPAKSPAFDADWEKNAFIERVVRDAAQWVEAQKVSGLTLEVVRLPGRTPVPSSSTRPPPAATTATPSCCTATWTSSRNSPAGAPAWAPGPQARGRQALWPWWCRRRLRRHASLTAIMALDKQGVPRPRCVGIVETCEESGSYDLLPYVARCAAAWATSRWWCAWTRAPATTTSSG